MYQQLVLNQALQFESLLPKWDMIHKQTYINRKCHL